MNLKIIIADDHSFFRKGVVMTINRLKYAEVIAEANNGQELVDLVKNLNPHIVLTDIKMPIMDGAEATLEILKFNSEIKIIALSMFSDEEHFQKMIEAGVQGFILKNAEAEDLDKALQTVGQDQQYFSPEFFPYFRNKYLEKNTKNSNSNLTKRELEILKYIALGLNSMEIAEKLFISLRTVTSHRTNINMKTGAKNTAGLLSYAIKNKLIVM